MSALLEAMPADRDGIPGPLGRAWGDTSICGHACQGTGILNNELYTGVLVWNRQRFVKDPSTGKRVSRPNPESEWIRADVPHLRICDAAGPEPFSQTTEDTLLRNPTVATARRRSRPEASFSRAFKKLIGAPPATWRKRRTGQYAA